jgi:hypothetical protein
VLGSMVVRVFVGAVLVLSVYGLVSQLSVGVVSTIWAETPLALSKESLPYQQVTPEGRAVPEGRGRAPANWSIGILEGRDIYSLQERAGCPNPRLSKHDIREADVEFVADPFLVQEGKEWFLFVEIFNKTSRKGEIGVATSSDLCAWRWLGIVLAESFHLSYPHLFKDQGRWVMIPESKQSGEVRVYRATSFPMRWEVEKVIISEPLSDPTPLFWGGRWWIFANRAPYSLALFSSLSLTGEYKEHAQSPLFRDDSARARPAGRIVLVNGAPVRFVQDNREGYGKRVRATRILELTDHEYREEVLMPDPFLKEGEAAWNGFGMHHIAAIQRSDGTWVAAVDGNAN